ncbi:MAG: hypothetical protein ABIB47_00430 [Candidatus Woesearchaeota archaeon]
MRFLKEKALFLIFLIVLSSFSLISLTEKVEAQQLGCCERTRSGEFCQYTDLTECDGAPFLSTPALCEDSSFCRLGCCFDSDSGECLKQTSKAECERKGGTWEESPLCEITQCVVGCCQISNQAFISTPTKCKKVTSEYENVVTTFDASIKDEFTCANSVRSGDLGCCVRAEGECGFGTRSECGLEASQPELDEEGNPIAGTQASEGAFHAGVLCSNDILKCNAAKQQKLGCYNEDVYWFDSEGNPENVFLGESSADKSRSYNGGRILEDAGCVATPGDKNCGNCDYTEGTLCAEKDGDVSCIDLNCAETTESDFGPDATGGAKEHGQSWCLYDGLVGLGRDRVGSRHFKAVCLNGEEIIEPCRDFREEYCTQSYSNGGVTPGSGSVYNLVSENLPQLIGSTSPLSNMFARDDSRYSEAACNQNRFDSCAQCNEFSSTDDAEDCCSEIAYRDCYFLKSGVTEKEGTCVPLVPPGLRFWGEELGSVLGRTQTDDDETTVDRTVPSAPGDDICSMADLECEVGFTRGGWDNVLGKSNWECTYNCQCLKEDFFAAAHSVCRSLGDCGSDFNWIGKFTEGGVDVQVDGPKGELAVPDNLRDKVKAKIKDDLLRDARVGVPEEGGGPDKPGFGDFFKKSAVPVGLILASGLAGIGTTAGFFGGVLRGPAMLFGGLGYGVSGVANLGTTPIGTALLGAPQQTAAQGTFGNLGAGMDKIYPPRIAAGQAPPAGFAMNGLPVNIAPSTQLGVGQTFVASGETTFTLAEGAGAQVFRQGATEGIAANVGSNTLGVGDKLIMSNGNAVFQAQTTGTLTGTSTGVQGITATSNSVASSWSALPTIWGAVQVVAWIWTIYNIVDVFFADTMTATGTFKCKSWEAPDGGYDCGECNEGELPCSEYRCRALGKACSIVNEGTEDVLCVNLLPNDASSPKIDPDRDAMADLTIEEKTTGFTVTERIPAFTPVNLAIKTKDEPAQCKFATEPNVEFEEMGFDFGDGLFDFEHELVFNLPSELTADQALELTNGGQYTLFVKCKDANGNPNRRDYTIKFGIQKGPDLTAPHITDTLIESGTFIAANLDAIPITIFVNEPVSCKWDRRNIDYDQMENTFSCAGSAADISSRGTYECGTSLALEKPNEGAGEETKQNDFFFRCKDGAGNKGAGSRFSLVSTVPLEIISKEPEGLLRTGTDIELKVETSKGAESGVAVCGYSLEDAPLTNIPQFASTTSQTHTQGLPPQLEGDYNFFVKCMDKAGNLVEDNIGFAVERDTGEPELVFVFKDTQLGVLTIKTNEPASCEFAENDFLFGRGTPMASSDNIEHEASLGQDAYLIKCQDFAEEPNEATFRVVP